MGWSLRDTTHEENNPKEKGRGREKKESEKMSPSNTLQPSPWGPAQSLSEHVWGGRPLLYGMEVRCDYRLLLSMNMLSRTIS